MTTAPAKLDRIANRAPRGGAVSPINGRFYACGTFMPMASAGVVEARPAPLVGSSRQVAWADRLRRRAIDRLTVEIATRRLFLSDRKPVDPMGVRRAIRRDEVARHSLMAERSAAAVIARRAELMP